MLNQKTANSILYYETKSERITCLKLQSKQRNILIMQVYAPNETAEDVEKDQFYEKLREVIGIHKKSRDQLIVMEDFNAKVGEVKEDKITGPFGLGGRNDRTQTLGSNRG